MPNTKNAIGYPTEDGGFEEMGNTAPKVNMTADDVSYDNSQSGASATNVQAAVDEAFSDLSELAINNNYNTIGTQINDSPYTVTKKGLIQVKHTGNTGDYTLNYVYVYINSIDRWHSVQPAASLIYWNNEMTFPVFPSDVIFISKGSSALYEMYFFEEN